MAQRKLKLVKRQYRSPDSNYNKVRRAALRIMAREQTCKARVLRRLIKEETGINARWDYFLAQLIGLPLMIDCESGMVFSGK